MWWEERKKQGVGWAVAAGSLFLSLSHAFRLGVKENPTPEPAFALLLLGRSVSGNGKKKIDRRR